MSSSASEFSTRSQPTCCSENRQPAATAQLGHEVTHVILGAANSRVDGKGLDELREEVGWRKWAGPAERIGDREPMHTERKGGWKEGRGRRRGEEEDRD